MEHYEYLTSGTCSTKIEYDIDENNCIHNLKFTGGCNGNLKAIGKLCEGMDKDKVKELLKGNTCGPRSTSCADQLSKALSR